MNDHSFNYQEYMEIINALGLIVEEGEALKQRVSAEHEQGKAQRQHELQASLEKLRDFRTYYETMYQQVSSFFQTRFGVPVEPLTPEASTESLEEVIADYDTVLSQMIEMSDQVEKEEMEEQQKAIHSERLRVQQEINRRVHRLEDEIHGAKRRPADR